MQAGKISKVQIGKSRRKDIFSIKSTLKKFICLP